MSWPQRRSGGSANFDPDRFNAEGVTVYSAADKTRFKILDLCFSMNEKVSLYLQYKKAGKIVPFANEEAQRSVQELFSFVRESAILWLVERETKIKKNLASKRPQIEKMKDATNDLEEDKVIIAALDKLDEGSSATDEFLILAKRFLNKYIYHRGISKLEIESGDPVDDYAKKAYGDDYKEDGT